MQILRRILLLFVVIATINVASSEVAVIRISLINTKLFRNSYLSDRVNMLYKRKDEGPHRQLSLTVPLQNTRRNGRCSY
ncbi:hypothetical protein C0J52_16162 [Blattella germanica]|nr:hypothetical protein C0J52_16162 [Blattella germanica]